MGRRRSLGRPPDIANPLLEDTLPHLESSRDHQRVAAHALAQLRGGEPLTEWATSDNPVLRLVAVERLPDTIDGELNPLLCRLTLDADRYVADVAMRGVAHARTAAAVEQLKSVATAQRGEWT